MLAGEIEDSVHVVLVAQVVSESSVLKPQSGSMRTSIGPTLNFLCLYTY
jgi:hypothetical protein